MSLPTTQSEKDGIFRPPTDHVYQIPTLPLMAEGINPLAGSIYTEVLLATENGVTAKDAFAFSNGKHATRNIFSFYRKEIGDVIFDVDTWDPQSVTIIERQAWMDKSEDDALAEIAARANEPSSEIEELILETLLGISGK